MYPHERSLVKRLENKPFALLAVNPGLTTDGSGDTPEALKLLIAQEEITWRFWYQGEKKTITKDYKVESYPTIIVLDHKGVIRFKPDFAESLDAAVDELLLELENEKTS